MRAATALPGAPPAALAAGGTATKIGPSDRPAPDRPAADQQTNDRQSLEIALLKARIQHLELIVETARGLMGSNQERLLRQLHDVPRDIVTLSAQLRRVDPQATW
jgi:hypothetical protein